jgi:hypothetical protein
MGIVEKFFASTRGRDAVITSIFLRPKHFFATRGKLG